MGNCVEGVPPSNRGQSLPRAYRGDARDTMGACDLHLRGPLSMGKEIAHPTIW
jgi:hypothetical protein